jgi:hypothetical protein
MSALDEILATIRRLPLTERLRLIERATLEVAEDTPKPSAVADRERRLSLDEFLAALGRRAVRSEHAEYAS